MKRMWLLLILGCAHTKPVPVERAKNFMPLAVGNEWTYAVNFLGQQSDRKVSITELKDGFFKDTQGGELKVDAYGIRDRNRYLLRNPIQAGTAWQNVISPQSSERYEIQSVAPCSVAAGKFDKCSTVVSKVRVDEVSELVNEMTFAEGVGLVRLEVNLQRESGAVPQMNLELTQFALRPEAL
jgi:hypothetical protein